MSGRLAHAHDSGRPSLHAADVDAVAASGGLRALQALTIDHRDDVAHAGRVPLGDGWRSASETLARAGIESVALSTCHRTELYYRAFDAAHAEVVAALFSGDGGIVLPHARPARLAGLGAARHLCRVCCGLESAVLGEAEILGQVRAALDAAPLAGPFLEGVFRAAIRAGRLARARTRIGMGALSVASTAVQWLGERIELGRSRVLVIGAGDTGAKVARQLRATGVEALGLANRTQARAEAIAARLEADVIPFGSWRSELDRVDAIVCAVRVERWLLTLDELRGATSSRRRPLVIVDLGMPAAIEPGDLPSVLRADLACVARVAAHHRDERVAEIPHVERVIEGELADLSAWARRHALRPLVSTLRQEADAIRRDELARARQELHGAAPSDVAVIERFSQRLLDRVLALPIARLDVAHSGAAKADAAKVRS